MPKRNQVHKQKRISADEKRLYSSIMPRWYQFIRQFGPNLGRPAFVAWLSHVPVNVAGCKLQIGAERAEAMENKICHSWLIHRGMVP